MAAVFPALEKAIYTAFFHAADKDKNGYLTIDELAYVTDKCGVHLTPHQLAETFIEMDVNNDWKITLEEFLNGMHNLDPGTRRLAKLKRELSAKDKLDQGYLSYREILNVAREKSDISEVDIENAIEKMKITDTKTIDYQVFIKVLQQNIH